MKKEKDQSLQETVVRLRRYLKERESFVPREVEDALWQDIKSQSAFLKRQTYRRRWLRYAGAAVLVLCLSGGILWLSRMPKAGDGLMEAVVRMPGSGSLDTLGKIQLNTSFGDHIRLEAGARQIIHQDEAVFVDQRQVSAAGRQSDGQAKLVYNEVMVPRGKHVLLTLSDGSVLNVNAGTRVVYPQTFGKDKREIFVEGEIFIDVKRQAGKPFVVRTSRFEVNVLGTAFNVRAYPDDRMAEVVLQRGRVEICDEERYVVSMQPDELVALSDGQYAGKHPVDAADYVSWTQGILTFRNERLGEVVRRLSRFYGRDVTCTPESEGVIISGKLDINEPLEVAVRTVAATSDLSVTAKDGGFELAR